MGIKKNKDGWDLGGECPGPDSEDLICDENSCDWIGYYKDCPLYKEMQRDGRKQETLNNMFT